MLLIANAIRSGSAEARPVLRIAVPAWRPRDHAASAALSMRALPSHDDFKRLLATSLKNHERIHGFTRAERKQLAVARRIRNALYAPG